MKKATKGALAAAAAGTLMVGGAGSLAYWTGTGTISGATINAGELSMSAIDCDPGAGTGNVWKDQNDAVFSPGTEDVVPGDLLTKVCTFNVTMSGKNIAANLTTTSLTPTGDLADSLDVNAVFSEGGNDLTKLTGAAVHAVTATITVDFADGGTEENATQNLSATLDAITVTATQTTP